MNKVHTTINVCLSSSTPLQRQDDDDDIKYKDRDPGRDLHPWQDFGMSFSKHMHTSTLAPESQQWRKLSRGWH